MRPFLKVGDIVSSIAQRKDACLVPKGTEFVYLGEKRTPHKGDWIFSNGGALFVDNDRCWVACYILREIQSGQKSQPRQSAEEDSFMLVVNTQLARANERVQDLTELKELHLKLKSFGDVAERVKAMCGVLGLWHPSMGEKETSYVF